MIHNTGRSCKDDISELTRRQQLDDPLLEIRYANIVAWGDHTSLVDTGSC